jgi:hypothetical protein
MRSTLVCCCLIAALGCAHERVSAQVETSSPSAPMAERDGRPLDADSCSHYLADAPQPREQREFMPVSEELMRAATVMASRETQPRCAHYELAHRVMVLALFEDPRVSQVLWEREDSVVLLDGFAEIANRDCYQRNPSRDEWQLPLPGFVVGRTELLGRPVVVIDMIAPPLAMTEAHMLAIVGHPWPEGADPSGWTGFDRYFVLEHSVYFEPTYTVMGGWVRSEGRNTHLNMGQGPVPSPSAFVHMIGRNLCGDFLEAMTELPS